MAMQNQSRFAQLLRRAFNVQGPLSGELLDDVFPSFDLIDSTQLEWAFMRGEKSWIGRNAAAAVAAQNSFVRIENPPASNILVMLDGFFAYDAAAAATIHAGTAFSSGVGATAGHDTRPRDGRGYSAAQPSGADIRAGSRVAALLIGARMALPAIGGASTTGTPYIALPCVLPPGWAFDVELEPVNQAFEVAFLFRTRATEPIEVLG